MAAKTLPDARIDSQGDVVSFDEGLPIPNYVGPVYANLRGRHYILWRHANGRYDVINAGSEIVHTALDKFIKENTD